MSTDVQSNKDVLFLGFDSLNAHFTCGTSQGLKIIQVEPFQQVYVKNFQEGGIGAVESISDKEIAFTGGGPSPAFENKILIYDIREKKIISEILCKFPVLSIRYCSDSLVVVTEQELLLYVRVSEHIFKEEMCVEMSSNPHGLLDLRSDGKDCWLAFPSATAGHVQIIRYAITTNEKRATVTKNLSIKTQTTFKAHESTLRTIKFNKKCTLLTTASEKGTLIRLYGRAGDTWKCLKEFKRGAYHSEVYSMAFSDNDSYICCTAASGTLHIFCINEQQSQENSSSFYDYFNFLSDTVAHPKSQFRSKNIEGKSICSFKNNDEQTIYVVTDKGHFIELQFDFSSKETEEKSRNVKMFMM